MNYYLNVKDVMEITGRKETTCYNLIRKLNKELNKMGKLTVNGKVPRKYFEERFGIGE